VSGTLYVVGTPIGNLADLTFRAKTTLNAVSIIAAEDTRTSRKLLSYYGIKTRLIAYHDNNEVYQSKKIINKLENGDSIAIISDAGTPGISDPGYRVVNLARKEGIEVVAIPGPSAVTTALSVAGIPTDHFYFEGFLPPKKGRKTRFELLESLPATVVIFESPQRVIRTLKDIHNYCGNRIISVCRELTKIYEEAFLGTVTEAMDYFSKSIIKGEFVLLIAKKGYTLD
jgi:16S rRNA (cytidine1402-2'-O)-methyltransferase